MYKFVIVEITGYCLEIYSGRHSIDDMYIGQCVSLKTSGKGYRMENLDVDRRSMISDV